MYLNSVEPRKPFLEPIDFSNTFIGKASYATFVRSFLRYKSIHAADLIKANPPLQCGGLVYY